MCKVTQGYKHGVEEHHEVNYCLMHFHFMHKNHIRGECFLDCLRGILIHSCHYFLTVSIFHYFSLE